MQATMTLTSGLGHILFSSAIDPPALFQVDYEAVDAFGNAATCVATAAVFDLLVPATQEDCPADGLENLDVHTLPGENYGRVRLFNTDIRDSSDTTYTIWVDGVVVQDAQLFDFYLSDQVNPSTLHVCVFGLMPVPGV